MLTTLGLVTTYNDTAVTNGTTYYYKLTALPGAPILDSATPSDHTVSLTWSAPASNGGSAVTGYRVYRSTTSGNETLLATVGLVTAYADTSAVNGSTYYYVVSAVNSVGEGVRSNERSAMPVTTPDAPSLITAIPGNSVTLTWNAPAANGGSPITGYHVYRSTTSGNETLLATLGLVTTYADETTDNGTTYYYEVSAFSVVGEGGLSNELSATPVGPDKTPPSKPASLKALVSGTSQIALDWADSTDNLGVAGYRLFRDGTLLTTATDSHYLDSGLAPGSSHVYQVRALDSSGNESLPSSNVTARAASLSTSTTAGNLVGVVYNAAGKLLGNAIVTVTLPGGTLKSAKTNASGVWKLSGLPTSDFSLSVSLAGYLPQTFSMTVVAGQTLVAVTALAPPAG